MRRSSALNLTYQQGSVTAAEEPPAAQDSTTALASALASAVHSAAGSTTKAGDPGPAGGGEAVAADGEAPPSAMQKFARGIVDKVLEVREGESSRKGVNPLVTFA